MIDTPQQQAVDAAITSRRSIRAFLPKAVERDDIEHILRVASRAPSGTNTQPWQVHVLTAQAKDRFCERLLSAYNDAEARAAHEEEYPYYPAKWTSPYLDRRRKVGWDLYGLLGLSREDKAGMHAQHGRNFLFFDAPVGMIFTIDRHLGLGSWLDYGMFLQNIMIAARGRGLDTCPQAAFNRFHRLIGEMLRLPVSKMVVCGMALGYADASRIENTLQTTRETPDNFTRYVDSVGD